MSPHVDYAVLSSTPIKTKKDGESLVALSDDICIVLND